MGPLSLKLSQTLQLNQAKVGLDNKRKEELHRIKLAEAQAKARQQLRQKEELHQAKLSDMGGGGAPLGKPEAALPEGDDQIAAVKTGEAIIPVEAAQDPANKPIIAAMVQQGRDAQDGYKRGTTSIPKPLAGRLQNENLLPLIPKIGKGKRMRGYEAGTTGVDLEEAEKLIRSWVGTQSEDSMPNPDWIIHSFKTSTPEKQQALLAQLKSEPIPQVQQPVPVQPVVVAADPRQERISRMRDIMANPDKYSANDQAMAAVELRDVPEPINAVPELQPGTITSLDGLHEWNKKENKKRYSGIQPLSMYDSRDTIDPNVPANVIDSWRTRADLIKDPKERARFKAMMDEKYPSSVPQQAVVPASEAIPALQTPTAPGTIPLKSHSTATSTTGTSVDWDKVSPAPDYNNILKSYQDAVPTVESLITKHGNDKDSFVEAFRDMFSYRGLKDLFNVNDGDIAKAAMATLVGKARGFSTADSFGYAGKMLYQTSQTRQAQQLSEANAAKRTVAQMESEARQNANNQYKGEMTTWKTEVEANKTKINNRIADGLKAAQARGKDVEGMYQKIIDGTANLPIEHRQTIINNAVAAMGSSTDPDAVYNKLLGVYTQSAANREASLSPTTALRVADGKPIKVFQSKSGALYDENDNRIDPRTVNLADDMKGDKERGADQLAVAFPDKIQDPKDPTKMIDNPYGGKEIRATMAESIIATGGRTTPQNMGAIGHIASAKLAKSKMPMTLGNAMLAIKDAVIERMNPAGSYQVIVDGTKTAAADPAQSMGITRQITSYAEEKNLDVGTVVKDIDAKWEQLKKNPVDYQKVLRATPRGQSPAVFFYTTKNKAELFR